MIHVGLNGAMLGERQVGLGKYAFELISHLRPTGFDVKVFIRNESDADGLTGKPGISFSIVEQPFSTGKAFVDLRLWELEMFRRAHRCDFDVFHSPYFVCSPYRLRSQVVMVADAIQYIYPQYVTSWPRDLYWKYNGHRIRGVQRIVTLSECSKEDVVRIFKKPETSVEVVYPGVAEHYQPVRDDSKTRQVSHRYSLPKRFVLYIGGFDFRKNVERLLLGYGALAKKYPNLNVALVLAGSVPKPIPGLVADLVSMVSTMGLSERVHFIGSVAEQDLPSLYTLADLLVYPSLYEGFGLPLVEAMSCGTAVVSSNASSIPEIVDQGDILFDPHDFKDISSKMERVLLDPIFREEVARWGIGRAKDFSWERAASKIGDIYLEGAGGSV